MHLRAAVAIAEIMERDNGQAEVRDERHRHAKVISAYWTINDQVHWRYSTRNLSQDGDENVEIRFFIIIKNRPIPQKSEAVRRLLKQIEKTTVGWMLAGGKEWTFDLDQIKREYSDLNELPWFRGSVRVEPEFEVLAERDDVGPGSYYETSVVFYIAPPSLSGALAHHTMDTPAWPRKRPFRPRILVMKGGGVKGIAYVGALEVLNEYGYQFKHYVGTSAGAISAALLAAGYTPTELGAVLARTDFNKFKDSWLPLSLLLLPFRKGLYGGEKFRVWLEDLLRAKFPELSNAVDIRFSHLALPGRELRRLTIFASLKGKSAHPFDSRNPADSNELISFACRCSMAIPYIFMPEKIAGKWAVDGGMQNNYPVYALLRIDPELRDSEDFVGLFLGKKSAQANQRWLLWELYSIWTEADDEAKDQFIDRTIVIDPRPVKTLDFSLSPLAVDFLLAEGKASALRWLLHWSDGKRPTPEIVSAAERVSTDLRGLLVKERKRRFLRRMAVGSLILLLLIAALIYIYK
jgi:hypothetical protein